MMRRPLASPDLGAPTLIARRAERSHSTLGLSPSKAIVVFAVLCGIALGLFWVSDLWRGHNAAIDKAKAVSALIALQLQEHAARSFHDIGLMAERVREQLADRAHVTTRPGIGEQSYLDGYVRALPQVKAVAVYGPRGEVITASGTEPVVATLRASNLSAVYAPARSPSLINFGADRRDLAYVERLSGPKGETIGIFFAVVELQYFSDFYRKIDLDSNGVVGLIADSGHMILRYPAVSDGGRLDAFRGTGAPPEGQYHFTSPIDGIDRIVTYARVEPFSVEVFAGFATDEVLVPWRSELIQGTGIAFGVALLLLVMGRLTWNAARGEEDMKGRLEQALSEKETLFREMHHRIKNNLQIVSSMVAMQAMQLQDSGDRDALSRLSGRIHSISALHQTLYEKDQADTVEFQALLEKIADNLTATYAADGRITTKVRAIGTATLDRALPVALVANEVISNAFKHAFPGGRCGRIDIDLRKDDGLMMLEIGDDGIGLAGGVTRPGGIGTSLMQALSAQIGGTMELCSDNGTLFRLTFPAPPPQ